MGVFNAPSKLYLRLGNAMFSFQCGKFTGQIIIRPDTCLKISVVFKITGYNPLLIVMDSILELQNTFKGNYKSSWPANDFNFRIVFQTSTRSLVLR